jgi:hypothetical protein
MLDSELLSLIERGSTVEGLRGMLADGTLRRARIRGRAQPVLIRIAS